MSLNRKITANKTKNLLVENELKKLKNFDSTYFIGKSHFEEDGTQNYLVFQPINRYFKVPANTDYVSSWKSQELSVKTIKAPTASDNSLTPVLDYYGTKAGVKFNGSCLQQPKLSYTHGKVVNIYTVYELGASSSHNNDPTLKNCWFVAVNLTENDDIDKYGYLCLNLRYNGANSYIFVNSTEIYKFKTKDSKVVAAQLCLGNLSKDWSVDNMKTTGFKVYVYDFCVDFDATDVDDVTDIQNYLMKKNEFVK